MEMVCSTSPSTTPKVEPKLVVALENLIVGLPKFNFVENIVTKKISS